MDKVDLNVFKIEDDDDDDDECTQDIDDNGNSIENCLSISRLVAGLKYYSLLDTLNNTQNVNIFNHFIQDIYKTKKVLDDFTHLVQKHGNDIKKIHQSLIKSNTFKPCDVNKCSFSARHHRMDKNSNNNNNNDILDPVLKFYKDTFDSVHFY
eukprot:198727_1